MLLARFHKSEDGKEGGSKRQSASEMSFAKSWAALKCNLFSLAPSNPRASILSWFGSPCFNLKIRFSTLAKENWNAEVGKRLQAVTFFSINYLSRQSAVALLKKLSNSLRSTTLSLMPFLVTLDQSEKWMTGPGAPLNVTDSNNRAIKVTNLLDKLA